MMVGVCFLGLGRRILFLIFVEREGIYLYEGMLATEICGR